MSTEQPHKRYLVFEVLQYEASGGIYDIVCTYDTLDEVKEYFTNRFLDEYHVYDRIEGIEIDIIELVKQTT